MADVETKPAPLPPLKPVVGKFRLRPKCGTHVEPGEKDNVRGKWFVTSGQVVEGRSHLSERFPEKFEKADDAAKVTATFLPRIPGSPTPVPQRIDGPPPDERKDGKVSPETVKEHINDLRETYKAMTVADLRAHAKDESVDLGTARTKDEIIEKILEHDGKEASGEGSSGA
jgi:hypothetical protein